MEELSQAPDAGFFDIDRGAIKVSHELGEPLIVNFPYRRDRLRSDELVKFIQAKSE